MLPRTFTRDKVQYHGFARVSAHQPILMSEILCLVWFDGEPDLYVCDDVDGAENVMKMYRDEWGDRDGMRAMLFRPV